MKIIKRDIIRQSELLPMLHYVIEFKLIIKEL